MPGRPVVIYGEMYDASLTVGWPLPPAGTQPPGNPPGIWGPGGPWPSPPINLPPGVGSGNPPGIWGGGNVPMPTPPIHLVPGGDIGGPPGIWGPGSGFPTNPIVIPPDFIEPGVPAHPIVIPPPSAPGVPTHPIVIPPDLIIWGPNDPRPTVPIVIPPQTPTVPPTPTHPIALPEPPTNGGGEGETPPAGEPMYNWEVKAYWTPQSGWGMALVPTEGTGPIVTPSGTSTK